MRRFLIHATVATSVVLTATVLAAAPASAHVSVTPSDATQGGYTKLTFRVPNEKVDAATTTVEVALPQDAPIASVSVKPIVGWTAVTTSSKLDKPIKNDDGEVTEAVTKIVWAAAGVGAGIQVGQFQEFDISVGPLPETDKITFKVLQTYSDGDIIRWIEEPASDGTEPEHPAPTLKLAKASSPDSTGGAATASTADKAARSRANLGLGLGIAAFVLALVGLVIAAMTARRRKSTPDPSA